MAQHRFFLKNVSSGAETELLGVIVAGKLPECGLQLQAGAAGGGPSRRHAELSVVDDTVWLEDLRSTNGTYINGERVTARTALKSGDAVRFDVEEFKFRAESPAPPEDRTAMREVPAAPAVPGSWVEEKGKSKTVFVDYSKLASAPTPGAPLVAKVDAPLLVVSTGSRAGARISLVAAQSPKREWSVGCDADREIVFTDKGVSGRHAKIVNEGTRWKLIDQLAANGTFVNGNRTNMSFLSSGDRLRFGPVECIFQLPEAGAGIAESIAGNRGRIAALVAISALAVLILVFVAMRLLK
jgi:pSer/pThr/pTyr-binding forkhead associated (FHA) protein